EAAIRSSRCCPLERGPRCSVMAAKSIQKAWLVGMIHGRSMEAKIPLWARMSSSAAASVVYMPRAHSRRWSVISVDDSAMTAPFAFDPSEVGSVGFLDEQWHRRRVADGRPGDALKLDDDNW